MADVFSKAKRSEVMSRIKGHGNKDTEVVLAKTFRAEGITGWRRHQSIFGKPDFAFRKVRLAIFVDGCFWHACAKHSKLPVNNRKFWKKKFTGNQARDRLVSRTLRKNGWRVIRIWEHELRKPTGIVARIRKALAFPQPQTGKKQDAI